MGDSESKLGDVERRRLGDEPYQHPLIPQTAVGTDPTDGLPRMTTSLTMADTMAPALQVETFVCMGEESVFVVRDLWDQVRLEFQPDEVKRSGDEYFVRRDSLSEPLLLALATVEDELRAIGALSPQSIRHQSPWLKVEPLRPQCVHYRRVMIDFEGSDKYNQVERVCSAQRTDGGEYFSLNNMRVHACEHRSPRDFVSEERLRTFDQRAIDLAKRTDAEYDVEGNLGILGDKHG